MCAHPAVFTITVFTTAKKCTTRNAVVAFFVSFLPKIWLRWCTVEPTRCFTPHKSWIFGQLAHCYILQGGGEMCMLCFLTLGASRHDKLFSKNKLCPNTSKDSLSCARSLKTQLCGTHERLPSGIHLQPVAINIGAVDDMIDTLWCDWWNFKMLFRHYQQNQPFGSWDMSLNTVWFDWWAHSWHASLLPGRPFYYQSQ